MTTVINTDKIIIEDTVDNNRRGINLTGKRLSKEERERQIQEAAKGIILEKGYENATMDDVIEKSGMSTGGVYHYYKSLYEIFYDIMFNGLNYGERRNLSGADKNVQTLVEYHLSKIYDDNEYKSLFAILLQGVARNEELRKMYVELNSIYEEKLYSDFEKSEVSKRMLGDKFLLFLIHSLILGYETFEPLGSKKVFNENEDFIREVIILYLKKFNDN
ncbi:TetR/AcrR family transcriptional regulator [Finegoldia magna]|uniref:TetR/AcrR family transcriptional regulator n=1 Tax=Finegoldia magna TaxID=1260 RepID=UPI00290EC372|nr:TetR/AcrR family transcriptional regulator [Finegoldia magna]MDU7925742.1 TetR/AcrR family transcriptional regulator [Finegoldia magna]